MTTGVGAVQGYQYGTGYDDYMYTDPALGTDFEEFPDLDMGTGIFGVDSNYMERLREQRRAYRDMDREERIEARENEGAVGAPMSSVRQACRNLHNKIADNDMVNVPYVFNQLQERVKAAYNLTDEEDIRNKALEIYEQAVGVPFEDDVRANGNSPLTNGFINGLTVGLFGKKSGNKAIAEVTKTPEDDTDKLAEGAGKVAGSAAAGAAIGAGIGVWFGGVGAGPGAAVGGVIGGVVGIFRSIF
ncbi:hypothetical protein IJ579_07645 [bacterium]|nr:hypothetical protein [bacterium]